MGRNLDFEALQSTWQREPEVELPDFRSMIQARTRWIVSLTVLDGIATVAILAFAAWLLTRDPGPAEWTLAGTVLALTAIGWVVVLRIRHGTWGVDSAAPTAMLDLMIRRCRASIQLALLNRWCIAFGFVIGLAFRFWLRPDLDIPFLEMTDPTRTIVRVLLLGVAVVWVAIAEWYRRRKQRELDHWLAVRSDLQAEL